MFFSRIAVSSGQLSEMNRKALCVVGFGSLTIFTTHLHASEKPSIEKNQKWEKLSALLPSADAAQQLSAVRAPKFLSNEEVELIIQFEEEHKLELGHTRRDGSGQRKLDSPWATSYLHTNFAAQEGKIGPIVNKLVKKALEISKAEKWEFISEQNRSLIGIRVIEMHKVYAGGSLAHIRHCDNGSIVTIDVMLAEDSDYSGGEFTTLEYKPGHISSNKISSNSKLLGIRCPDEVLTCHTFQRGDMMVFPSHKYHCVQPVVRGCRKVMVMELWYGEDRSCAHRCMQPTGVCGYTLGQSYLENLIKVAPPEVDPW